MENSLSIRTGPCENRPAKRLKNEETYNENVEELEMKNRLFSCLRAWQNHSEIATSAAKAGIYGTPLKEDLFRAATVRVRNMKTLETCCSCLNKLSCFRNF